MRNKTPEPAPIEFWQTLQPGDVFRRGYNSEFSYDSWSYFTYVTLLHIDDATLLLVLDGERKPQIIQTLPATSCVDEMVALNGAPPQAQLGYR